MVGQEGARGHPKSLQALDYLLDMPLGLRCYYMPTVVGV